MGEFTNRRMHLSTSARPIHILSVNMGPFDIHQTELYLQDFALVACTPDILVLTGIPRSASAINVLVRLGYREYFASGNDWPIGITIAVKNGIKFYVDKANHDANNGLLLGRVIFQETVLGLAFLCNDLGLGTNPYAEIEKFSENSRFDALLFKMGERSPFMQGFGEEAGWRLITKDLAIKKALKNITIDNVSNNEGNQTASFMLSASKKGAEEEESFNTMDIDILPVKRPYPELDDSSDGNGSLRPLKKPRRSIY